MLKYFLILLTIILINGCSTVASDNGASIKYNDESATRDYDLAHSLIEKGKIDEAMDILLVCGEYGHGGCSQVLADLYIYGEGREPDIDSAIYWHTKTWETGIRNNLAGIYSAYNLTFYYCSFEPVNIDVLNLWLERATTLAVELGNAYVEKVKEPTKDRLAALDKINKKLKERKEQLNSGVCVPDITRN